MQVREILVCAVLGAGNFDFNIVSEIKLIYARMRNFERFILSSRIAVDVFREHSDTEKIDYNGAFFSIYVDQANKFLRKEIPEYYISFKVADLLH